MTPTIPLPGLQGMLIAVGAVIAGFVGIGAVHDLHRRRRRKVVARAHANMAALLSGDEERAATAAERLARAPRRLLIDIVQGLAADLDGEADVRLRRLVAATGLARSIRRDLKNRHWRRRARTASLATLLPPEDPLRTGLLYDPNPLVRARVAETMEPGDIVANVNRLTALLGDPTVAVKFAAQQALLRGGARVVPALAAQLLHNDDEATEWGLELAANIPDPHLADAIRVHLRSASPRNRAVAVRALAPWLTDARELAEMLHDADDVVRATAAQVAGEIGATALASTVGRLLGDRSWLVRNRAGHALAEMGAAGVMTLRVHLANPDPYAQDMAHQVLDTINAGNVGVTAEAVA